MFLNVYGSDAAFTNYCYTKYAVYTYYYFTWCTGQINQSIYYIKNTFCCRLFCYADAIISAACCMNVWKLVEQRSLITVAVKPFGCPQAAVCCCFAAWWSSLIRPHFKLCQYWHCITQNTLYCVIPWFMVTVLHCTPGCFSALKTLFFDDYIKINRSCQMTFH